MDFSKTSRGSGMIARVAAVAFAIFAILKIINLPDDTLHVDRFVRCLVALFEIAVAVLLFNARRRRLGAVLGFGFFVAAAVYTAAYPDAECGCLGYRAMNDRSIRLTVIGIGGITMSYLLASGARPCSDVA